MAQSDGKTLCPIKVEAERFSNLEAITGMTPSHSEVGKTCPKTGRNHSEVGIYASNLGHVYAQGGESSLKSRTCFSNFGMTSPSFGAVFHGFGVEKVKND
jgi:hypothetical protein